MENDLIKNIILLIVCHIVVFFVFALPSQKTTSLFKKFLWWLLNFIICAIILYNFTDIDGIIFVGTWLILTGLVIQLIVLYIKSKYKIK